MGTASRALKFVAEQTSAKRLKRSVRQAHTSIIIRIIIMLR